MAVAMHSAQNVQIAITLEDSFMNAIPNYFQLGEDGKLHHDPNQVNVFAHKKLTGKHLFADSYGEVLNFTTPGEFSSIKGKLLGNPIFLHVRLQKEKHSGNVKYITRGSFIVFINTRHPIIQQQLIAKLDQVHELVSQGRNVALELNFGSVLNIWFKANFPESSASYSAEESNFCITNFSQRYHDCYSPLTWVVCLPCCLLGAPFYCIHRHCVAKCVDLELLVQGQVQYTAGVSETERNELVSMLVRAYAQGRNDAVTSAPANYAPPPYSTLPPNNQQGYI